MRVVVSGASGFVGSQLATALVAEGHEVVAMTRDPGAYDGAGTPVFGDLHRPDSLVDVMAGAQAAYFLVHELGDADLGERERRGAVAFGEAAGEAGLAQLIYLGGLGSEDDDLSAHLRSRRDVEDALALSGVPLTVVRAGIVIGPGSLSWELLRQIATASPITVAPTWAETRCQPIAVRDIVWYLVHALGVQAAYDRTFEVGAPDVLSYREMLQRVALAMGRPSALVEVPVLPAPVLKLGVRALTDVDADAAAALLESMRNEAVVRDRAIDDVLPYEPMRFDDAVRLALDVAPA